jgi:putative hydrolase of the HAD superfamily
MPARLPLAELETLCLDAGNTLLSIDFDVVAFELGRCGVRVSAAELARAEAAARPAVSSWIAATTDVQRASAGPSPFVENLLGHLPAGLAPDRIERARIVRDVMARIHRPGASHELWNVPLPGVAEALAELRDLGLQLIVVSNADGTVDQGLARAGLLDLVDRVIDSHVVGIEKPDPRIFEHALAGASPASALHVGDLYATDVVGARAAGLHALLLDPFDDWPPVDCARLPDVPALARAIRQGRAGPCPRSEPKAGGAVGTDYEPSRSRRPKVVS